MAETYCGKTCAECTYKENLDCPGCKDGPGRPLSGDCQLARCCRDKGHENCQTCGFHIGCNTLRGRGEAPAYRLKKQNAEAERQAAIIRKAPFLGKWIWLLFLLVIPETIASILKNETIVEWIPALVWPGQILYILCLLAYGVILLKLSSESEHYRTAGICNLVSVGITLAVTLISGGGETPGWTLLLTLPALVLTLVGEYREYAGHEEVLSEVDAIFADKWKILWKWYIGVFAATFGGIVLAFVNAILALLLIIAASIGMIVIDVVKLLYLYRMAKLFQEIARE